MDMFREPKFAAYVYASQCEPHEEVILQPVTFWARGERNIGGILPLIVLTNCDEIELTYGNHPPKRVGPDRDAYPHLPHPPVIVDRRHFTEKELGLWGMEWLDAKIVGYVGGKPAKEIRFVADPVAHRLDVIADREALHAGGKDSVRVMVRALDQAGNKLPFLFEPVEIAVEGPASLVGPNLVPLRGGSTGFWLESTGTPGPITVRVTGQRFGTTTISLSAT
jgi:beta-galactosidase